MNCYQAAQGGVYIYIYAQPGAKKTQIQGLYQDRIKIRVHAPAQEGKANDELIQFLRNLFDVTKKQINITSGQLSQQKTVFISDVQESDILNKLKKELNLR